jgi:hypothetical protein
MLCYLSVCLHTLQTVAAVATTATISRYRNPGPVQFAGDTADSRLMSLELESNDYFAQLQALRVSLTAVSDACKPGCSSALLKIATKQLENLRDIMSLSESK